MAQRDAICRQALRAAGASDRGRRQLAASRGVLLPQVPGDGKRVSLRRLDERRVAIGEQQAQLESLHKIPRIPRMRRALEKNSG